MKMRMCKNKLSVNFILLVVLAAMPFSACSGDSRDDTSSNTQPTKAQTTKQQASATALSGWQKISHENYTFFIPGDWKADGDTDMWAPQDQLPSAGRPNTSLHIGAIPPLPGKSQDELLEFYYGTVPAITHKTQKCGTNSFFVEANSRGDKHLGLILVEKVGPMTILNFLDCQAAESKFSENQATFQKILESVECR